MTVEEIKKTMFNSVALLIVFIAYMAFCLRRGMTYLHLFQQEEYDGSRFVRLIMENRVVDTRLSLALFLSGVLWFVLSGLLSLLITCLCFAVIVILEADPRNASKKKLVMTQRARRIYFVALLIMLVMGLWWFVFPLPWIWIVNVQAVPFILIIANAVLQPYESSVQNKFWQEAHKKLVDLDPKIIGITGSFGKTSVKHILGHVLKTQAPTLITPGSVNTPMGITRIVREQLDETHKYFIVEMGAYGPGSIERLCRLAPPDMGVITAIGQAHYERFKSLDTVAEAKFELAESVTNSGGTMIVHDSCLRIPYARQKVDEKPAQFVICGEGGGVHAMEIRSVSQTPAGLEVRIAWKNTPYTLNVPLFGLHHGHNAALVFATAATLGIPPENIVAALKSVPQITHRLEVKKQGDGTILIDDAFNSNPEGFRSALDVLAAMQGRKILITPGMVELGEAHEEEHEKIGLRAGEVCDTAVIVLPERIPTFIKGFRSTANGKALIEVASFKEASEWLDRNKQPGDAVLIENDLPDIYERLPTL